MCFHTLRFALDRFQDDSAISVDSLWLNVYLQKGMSLTILLYKVFLKYPVISFHVIQITWLEKVIIPSNLRINFMFTYLTHFPLNMLQIFQFKMECLEYIKGKVPFPSFFFSFKISTNWYGWIFYLIIHSNVNISSVLTTMLDSRRILRKVHVISS